jgi:hypothetical protein
MTDTMLNSRENRVDKRDVTTGVHQSNKVLLLDGIEMFQRRGCWEDEVVGTSKFGLYSWLAIVETWLSIDSKFSLIRLGDEIKGTPCSHCAEFGQLKKMSR